MLFNSIEYLLAFLPIVFFVYFILNKFKFYNASKVFLILASLFFYGSYKLEYIYIILVSIIFNYSIGLIIKKIPLFLAKKIVLTLGIVGNAVVLIFFKYFSSIIQILSRISYSHIDAIKIIIPLGISFFTIQQISYIIDCYKGNIKQNNIIDYTLFICFFPQLIAGPIVRYKEMIPQFNNLKNKIINHDNIYIALFLITVGLFKKTVIADGYTPFIDYVIEYKIYDNFYISWLYGILRVLQGYFDFSAYCDLALGSAFLFNISLPWNFNSPFQATNIIDFWKRWNMTLIRFLRRYIYIPLNQITKNRSHNYKSIMVVFLTMGLWIGFSPMSILYGISNGVCVCINKWFQFCKLSVNKYLGKLLMILSIIFTTQILFAKSFDNLIRMIKSMFYIDTTPIRIGLDNFGIKFTTYSAYSVKLNIIILLFSLIAVFFLKNSNILAKQYVKNSNFWHTILLIVLFVYATLSVTKDVEFIYFAF